MWEHTFVAAEGSAYHRFRRALDLGNRTEALSAACELSHVGLVEALELCLLLIADPRRYEAAALRWHGRFVREAGATFEEAQAILGCLAAMRGPRAREAALALAELTCRRGLERGSEIGRASCRERV